MTFEDAYNYTLSFNNLPRTEYMNDPKSCDIYLKRLQFFLNMLGNPEKKIPHYIHVTGTSGKGSTTSFLHSILHASGKKVGSTYSPHPTYITERWKIDNRYMSKKEFVLLVGELKPLIDKYIQTTPYDMISFFELTEVIGFLWFARNSVEWVVLEVACGGRFDSSNVIPYKDIAVITNIGLDHVGIIGNNKKEIAYEKAGIIKKGCAVFTSEKDPALVDIIQTECDTNGVPCHTADTIPEVVNVTQQGSDIIYHNTSYHIPILGEHQIDNAILCIQIAESLHIDTKTIQQGLRTVVQPLRMEPVSMHPLIILDGAHNVDKISSTVKTVQTFQDTVENIHLVLGFSADKNLEAMVHILMELQPHTVACTRNTINILRKVASPKDIQTLVQQYCPSAHTRLFLDPKDAFIWSNAQQEKQDLLLVTGSIFLSGEIRGIL